MLISAILLVAERDVASYVSTEDGQTHSGVREICDLTSYF